jgi:hypothetical protein
MGSKRSSRNIEFIKKKAKKSRNEKPKPYHIKNNLKIK